jgi:hypothetical protein
LAGGVGQRVKLMMPSTTCRTLASRVLAGCGARACALRRLPRAAQQTNNMRAPDARANDEASGVLARGLCHARFDIQTQCNAIFLLPKKWIGAGDNAIFDRALCASPPLESGRMIPKDPPQATRMRRLNPRLWAAARAFAAVQTVFAARVLRSMHAPARFRNPFAPRVFLARARCNVAEWYS